MTDAEVLSLALMAIVHRSEIRPESDVVARQEYLEEADSQEQLAASMNRL